MLRECRRVLLPTGVIAGYVIHVREGIGSAERERAVELGPAYAALDGTVGQLMSETGFALKQATDVTSRFRETLATLLDARTRLERELRHEEGDEVFEETQARRRGTLQAVDEGLLVRTMWVATPTT